MLWNAKCVCEFVVNCVCRFAYFRFVLEIKFLPASFHPSEFSFTRFAIYYPLIGTPTGNSYASALFYCYMKWNPKRNSRKTSSNMTFRLEKFWLREREKKSNLFKRHQKQTHYKLSVGKCGKKRIIDKRLERQRLEIIVENAQRNQIETFFSPPTNIGEKSLC